MSSPDDTARPEQWVSALFARHSTAILHYARRRLPTPEDAEDVVVEVFATAWRRREEIPDAALPWLYATASHAVAHAQRSQARRSRLGSRLASVRHLHDDADPAQVVAARSTRDTVVAALAELAEPDAELLRLWAWEQLEPTEIATVVGCTPGAARTRLHRARGRLREALARRGIRGPDAPGTSPTRPLSTGSEDPR